VLAFKRGYTQWSEADREVDAALATYTSRVLDELRAASAQLG